MNLLKRAGQVLLTVVVVFFTLTAIVSFFSSPAATGFFGWKGYTVVSGSMEPTFSAGDFILVRTIPYEEVKAGDVITFTRDETIVSHRVKEVTAEGLVTQGDANHLLDQGRTTKTTYIGKLAFMVPYYGYLIAATQKPIFFALLVALLGLYLIYWYLTSDREKAKEAES